MIHVNVYKIKQNLSAEQIKRFSGRLEPVRRARVESMKNEKTAAIELWTGLLLQKTIRHACKTPEDIPVIKTGAYGKPYLEGYPDFHFNLSHSGDYIAVAYGDMPLGVDLEVIKAYRPEVMKRCYSEAEAVYVADKENDASDIDRRFFAVWTMKESYVKYTGKGLSEKLSRIRTDIERLRVENTDAKLWVKQEKDYVLSICAENTEEIFYEKKSLDKVIDIL